MGESTASIELMDSCDRVSLPWTLVEKGCAVPVGV